MCELYPNYAYFKPYTQYYPRYGWVSPNIPLPTSSFKLTRHTLISLMEDNSITIKDIIDALKDLNKISPDKHIKLMEVLDGK